MEQLLQGLEAGLWYIWWIKIQNSCSQKSEGKEINVSNCRDIYKTH